MTATKVAVGFRVTRENGDEWNHGKVEMGWEGEGGQCALWSPQRIKQQWKENSEFTNPLIKG